MVLGAPTPNQPLSPLDIEGYVKGGSATRGDPATATMEEQNTFYVHDAVLRLGRLEPHRSPPGSFGRAGRLREEADARFSRQPSGAGLPGCF